MSQSMLHMDPPATAIFLLHNSRKMLRQYIPINDLKRTQGPLQLKAPLGLHDTKLLRLLSYRPVVKKAFKTSLPFFTKAMY